MIRHTNPGDGLRLRYRGFSDASNPPVPSHRYRIAECAQHYLTSQAAWPAILARARRNFPAGYDPTDELGKYYAAEVFKAYDLLFMVNVSYAAYASASHYLVGREWSQFRFADISQRYGFAFLKENSEDGIGRRAPTAEEKSAFWAAAAKQMKDIYEVPILKLTSYNDV